jgi:hypothetical protein
MSRLRNPRKIADRKAIADAIRYRQEHIKETEETCKRQALDRLRRHREEIHAEIAAEERANR